MPLGLLKSKLGVRRHAHFSEALSGRALTMTPNDNWLKDFPSARQGKGGNNNRAHSTTPAPPRGRLTQQGSSSSTCGGQRQNRLYSLRAHQDQEDSLDVVTGFNILFFYPNIDKDFASYTKFLRYLSSRDRVGAAKLDGGTNMFLFPPSDFIRKVLKVDRPTCFYRVVLKSTPHTPSGISLPPESYQPQYVDAPEKTSSKVSQVRSFLTNDLITSLSKFQPSSSVEGTRGMPQSDVTIAIACWRYVNRLFCLEDIKMLG
uniref:RNA recognition motif-containing protein n=1 Tax=Solanum tuberosum TaxID=4113 RepID=M1DU36_SOLTU